MFSNMEARLLFLFVACLTFHKCTGIQWASGPEENAVIYVCARGSLSLPWTLLISHGEVIESIQWFFSGRSEELIAMESRDHFVALPAFYGRVSKTANAGIDVHHMEHLDTGNYSVEVLARQASGDVVSLSLWRSSFVYVTDGLQTVDGRLHVTQLPVAEYNYPTDQYHVVLSCGNFTYLTQPPFMATWLTPSGRSLDIDKYDDNQFFLPLPNPVEGGSYICRVASPSACLHGNSSVEGTVTVDKMEARLAVLEARQVALESRNAQLESVLKSKDAELATMANEISTLKAKTDILLRAVSFHATVSGDRYSMPVNSALKFDRV